MLEFKGITKRYGDKLVLNNISFKIDKGDCVSIVGKSGKGKTTILNILGLLEKYDSGTYLLDGCDVSKLNKTEETKIFREKIGYLFQNFALIDDESVLFNLDLSILDKSNKKKNIERINEALSLVGLSDRLNSKVYQLSGGEQQRVAIARLFLKDCSIILADEPTGSLDSENRDLILNLLAKLQNENKTIIIVTHDTYVANWCSKIFRL